MTPYQPPGLALEKEPALLHWQADPAGGAGDGFGLQWRLQIATRAGTVIYSPGRRECAAGRIAPAAEEEKDPGRAARLAKAGGKAAIYLTAHQARGSYLDKHLAFMRKNGFNALVVDCNDDLGNVTYPSKLPAVRRLGAAGNLIDPAALLKKAKAQGAYVIARVVVFKDQRLYGADGHKYAVWDRIADGPWGYRRRTVDPKTGAVTTVQGEHWVDPHAREVWEYNVAIAKELEELGFDEIQFDYVRFPTDGDLSRIKYRYRPEGEEKADALESFLAMARERLQAPISADLYGFNCWYRIENWTGQNLELFAPYIDVVCPMFYPSHFPSGFARNGSYLERARTIYSEGTARAHAIAGGGILVRPYVQAFLIGNERKMAAASYTKYLTNQIDGTLAAPSSGYTLWNAACRYFMVKAPVPRPAAPSATP